MNIKKSAWYLIFFLLSLNLSIVHGLYYYDLLVLPFLVVALLFGKVHLSNESSLVIKLILILLFFPAFLGMCYQIVFLGILEKYSIYIPYNLTVLIMYILFFDAFKGYEKLNYTAIVFMFSIPVIISLLMIFIPAFNDVIIKYYNIERTLYMRHGGIWGDDVNQMGFYSMLHMILSYTLYRIKKIPGYVMILMFVLSISTLLLSGMRTGLVVLLGLMIFSGLFFGSPFIARKHIAIVAGITVVMLFLTSVAFPLYFETIIARFDVYLFIEQLVGSSGDGHVGDMYLKWFSIFFNERNILDILFSFYPEWKYPDSLVIFILANSGLFGLVTSMLFVSALLTLSVMSNNNLLRQYVIIIVLMLVAVSFKGIFAFNNIGMFLFVFLYYLIKSESDRSFVMVCIDDYKK